MRLKVKADHGLVLLCKKPAFFCRSVDAGEAFEVDDELGHALLAQYPAHLAAADDEPVVKPRTHRQKA